MRIIVLLFAFSFSSCVSVTYVVRHAEKQSGALDPALTPEGEVRAQALAQLLSTRDIKEIYSTDYTRTRLTAKPSADMLDLEIKIYGSDTLQSFVDHQLLTLGKNRLVVGHSNTILPIVQCFGLTPTVQQIPDDDYDNLFIVRRSRFLWGIKIKLEEMTYGEASP